MPGSSVTQRQSFPATHMLAPSFKHLPHVVMTRLMIIYPPVLARVLDYHCCEPSADIASCQKR